MAGSGVRTYGWQRRKERERLEGIFQGNNRKKRLPTIMFASLPV
jgi:hypothetical protein